MSNPKKDLVRETAEELLRRRLEYSPGPPTNFDDLRDPPRPHPPPPHPPDPPEKKASAFTRELCAIIKEGGLLQRILSDPGNHKQEIAGLATLMAAPIDQLQAHGRAAFARDYNKEGVKKRELLHPVAHPALEAAGLGVLMGPSIKGLRGH